jgi:hypothetical protein
MGGTNSVSNADGIHVAKGSAIGVGSPGWEMPCLYLVGRRI